MNFDNDKKYLILEKAKDMIITDGYSNLSISKLTSEINISKGSFYTYFSSKDKMLGKILDEYIENTKIFTNNLLNIPKNLDECLDYYINSVLNLTDDELKLELVMVNLRRNYEVFNEENFIKKILQKYIADISIEEKNIERCARMIFSISEVFLMMENIDFNSPKFSIKSLEEVKKSYKSGDMKEHLEFIKKSVKKILY